MPMEAFLNLKFEKQKSTLYYRLRKDTDAMFAEYALMMESTIS
jgi:hypothetical protein